MSTNRVIGRRRSWSDIVPLIVPTHRVVDAYPARRGDGRTPDQNGRLKALAARSSHRVIEPNQGKLDSNSLVKYSMQSIADERSKI